MEHMTTTDIQPAGVQMTGLVKSYGSVRAVQGIDLTIAPGETLALLGPNGAGGERVVDQQLAASTLAAGESPLTPRERDVLIVARSGATIADIASKLYLSEGTVRNYLSSAIAKTNSRNRLEALRVADERGWL